MLIFPVFIPQKGCPFDCIYCDQHQFSSVKEIAPEILSTQLSDFCTHHRGEEKQIAFYGGTFTGLSGEERNHYYSLAEPFLDEQTTLRISTRPDCVGATELNWCKTHQVKTIELGIQDFNDVVLKAAERGYGSQTAIEACHRVSGEGFELGIQLMPGLPGSNPDTVRESAETLKRLSLRSLRLYPLIVLMNTRLWEIYQQDSYQPLSLDEAIEICAGYHELADEQGFIVIKTGIPPLKKDTEYAGPYHPAFGELVKGELLSRKIIQQFKGESVIQLSVRDISLFRGHNEYTLKKLCNRLETCKLRIEADPGLTQGQFRLSG